MQSLNCPKCGAGLQIENQFIRTITCAYCGSNFLVRGSDGLDLTGKSHLAQALCSVAGLGDMRSGWKPRATWAKPADAVW